MKYNSRLMLVIVALILLVSACSPVTPNETPYEQPISEQPSANLDDTTPGTESPPSTVQIVTPSPDTIESSLPIPIIDAKLQVYYLDVGQGDCILLKTDGHAMLIDAGNTGQDRLILDYLSEYGVNHLDYLIETHPHADHIGSMSAVIDAMDGVDTQLMPDIIHTTVTFEKLLDAIEEKDIPVSIPKPGEAFIMGQTSIHILAPNSENYSDLNNYSIVLRVEFGQTVFLFAGDAEDVSEAEQIRRGWDLSADVLKVGHHGSNSGTTEDYIQAVSPQYAIISVGEGNTYGHPHTETIFRLTSHGITIYRTDEVGTVGVITDGTTITVNTEHEIISEPSTPSDEHVNSVPYIGNKNSKIFHLQSCKTLPAEKNRVPFATRDGAINAGYKACMNCNP